jgi:hypothetical protein
VQRSSIWAPIISRSNVSVITHASGWQLVAAADGQPQRRVVSFSLQRALNEPGDYRHPKRS